VVDPTSHAPLPDGQQGLLLAAGPGVTAGYYNDAEATHKAFIDGWFDTGKADAAAAGCWQAVSARTHNAQYWKCLLLLLAISCSYQG
jgi:non-ribosomal peptide synthetase component E (peptide arylation enzyme)